MDGMEVEAVSPFTVIYARGFNPLLTRPVIGIGSFVLPPYESMILKSHPFQGIY